MDSNSTRSTNSQDAAAEERREACLVAELNDPYIHVVGINCSAEVRLPYLFSSDVAIAHAVDGVLQTQAAMEKTEPPTHFRISQKGRPTFTYKVGSLAKKRTLKDLPIALQQAELLKDIQTVSKSDAIKHDDILRIDEGFRTIRQSLLTLNEDSSAEIKVETPASDPVPDNPVPEAAPEQPSLSYRIVKGPVIVTRIVSPAEAEEKETFRAFVTRVHPKFQWHKHANVIADVLQSVADGRRQRVMVLGGPRLGLSTLSRLFSAYYLTRHYRNHVGIFNPPGELASYSAARARAFYGASLQQPFEGKWEENNAGGFIRGWGVGGALTGNRLDLAVIDAPSKISDSEQDKELVYEWYQNVLSLRVEDAGAIVLFTPRLTGTDLVDRLANEDEKKLKHGEQAEQWHVVELPEIAEREKAVYPATWTVEPDWRVPGEPLRTDIDLMRLYCSLGPAKFAALYQQRPQKSGLPPCLRDFMDFLGSKGAVKQQVTILEAIAVHLATGAFLNETR
jgi:hypothetical protein